MPGPAPTPTKILEKRGSWKAKTRPAEPEPLKALPTPPEWLEGEAREEFLRLARDLRAMSVLSRTDERALARFCRYYVLWSELQSDLDKETLSAGGFRLTAEFRGLMALEEKMHLLEQQFGLTPSARTRIQVVEGEKGDTESKYIKVGAQ